MEELRNKLTVNHVESYTVEDDMQLLEDSLILILDYLSQQHYIDKHEDGKYIYFTYDYYWDYQELNYIQEIINDNIQDLTIDVFLQDNLVMLLDDVTEPATWNIHDYITDTYINLVIDLTTDNKHLRQWLLNNIELIYNYVSIDFNYNKVLESLTIPINIEISGYNEQNQDYTNMYNLSALINDYSQQEVSTNEFIKAGLQELQGSGLAYLISTQGYSPIEFIHYIINQKNTNPFFNSLINELDNICYSMNKLIACVQMDLNDLQGLYKGKYNNITIPCYKTIIGAFNPWNGSGSVLDIQLNQDIVINIMVINYYDSFHVNNEPIKLIKDGYDGYSISEVYGIDSNDRTIPTVK